VAVLGALEVKFVIRCAEQRPDWRMLHSVVMGCLLAHSNRHTGNCWPERRLIAAYCRCSERTVDRAIDQLVGWGVMRKQQPKAVRNGQFAPRQFTILFPPVGQNQGCRETKTPEPVGQDRDCNQEEEKDLKQGKDPKPEQAEYSATYLAPSNPSQQAVLLMELLALPENTQIQKAIEKAITAESKFTGQTVEQAAESILDYVERDRMAGRAIDYYYWRDAKWRLANGPGEGASKAIERSNRLKASLVDTLRRRHSERVAAVRPEQQDGNSAGAARRIPAGLRRY
jgi:hypothetical protein